MAELDRLPVRKPLLAGPGDEFVQERGVGSLRVLRLPAFVAEVLQEVFDQSLHRLPAPRPLLPLNEMAPTNFGGYSLLPVRRW